MLNKQAEKNARKEAWDDYLIAEKLNTERFQELMYMMMYFDGANKTYTYTEPTAIPMRFKFECVGQPDENGYPVYIFLHGGGQTLSNDASFEGVKEWDMRNIKNGIHITCRGIRETYNTHFNPESYPLYDRLIQNMIIYTNADPNRVYLTGYSAGGDGVYGITPYMPDRFAAVAMSAGHHNQAPAHNYMNIPIILQCGDKDTAYDRHLETVRYAMKLKEMQAQYQEGYTHELLMHVKKGHQIQTRAQSRAPVVVWEDGEAWMNGGSKPVLKNSNTVDFVNQFVRNPLPNTVVWNLAQRAPMRLTQSYYWLNAPASMDKGILHCTRNGNTFTITTKEAAGTFDLLLNWDMVDFDQPIVLDVNGKKSEVTATPSVETIKETTQDRGDVNFQFSAKVAVTV